MSKFRVGTTAALLILCVFFSGCGDKFLDPTQIGRFRPTPAVNVILDSLGVAEEELAEYEGAEEPKPIDLLPFDQDHVFAPGDIVRLSIYELLQEGATFTNEYVITETGKLSIPEVGVVEAGGLTESQLEEEIKQILSPGILKDPSVTVVLMSSEQRTFSILGEGVPVPGRYKIPRTDFRLADALATAGGYAQFNVSNVYITRKIVAGEELIEEDDEEKQKEIEQIITPEREMLEMVVPRTKAEKNNQAIIASSEMISEKELEEAALPESFAPLFDETMTSDANVETRESDSIEEQEKELMEALAEDQQPMQEDPMKPLQQQQEQQQEIEWVFQDGKWVPVQKGKEFQEIDREQFRPEKIEEFQVEERGGIDWTETEDAELATRVIKIPIDKIGTDPKYNVIIRPGDTIKVERDIVGEFYISGNVNNQGVITLSGRPMTLKMAIAAAGGLGPLAWPKKCEVVRRISEDEEEIVMVDLDKIASGEQPDFFIKPNDLINVGTHPTSRWRAVLRNAFRATYGFGFLYDRNFADIDFGTRRPFGGIF